MTKQVHDKIDFKIRYKMIYIFVSFLSSIIAIVALKTSNITIGIESASTAYIAGISGATILIMLFSTIALSKHPRVRVRIKEKYYLYIKNFANDCKDNVIPAILINIPIAAFFSIELTRQFSFQNLLITCLLYLFLFAMPLAFAKAVVSIHNSIVDFMTENQKSNEHQVNKISTQALCNIKINKSSFIWNVAISITICTFCFVLWYLYANSLPKLENTDKISAIFNFFIAVCTIALSIFGWHGVQFYKSTTRQYIHQKKLDHSIESAKKIGGLLFFHIFNISGAEYNINAAIEHIYGFNKEHKYPKLLSSGFKDKFKTLEGAVDMFVNDWKKQICPEIIMLKTLNNNKELDKLTDQVTEAINNMRRIQLFIPTLGGDCFIQEDIKQTLELVKITGAILDLNNHIQDILKSILHHTTDNTTFNKA